MKTIIITIVTTAVVVLGGTYAYFNYITQDNKITKPKTIETSVTEKENVEKEKQTEEKESKQGTQSEVNQKIADAQDQLTTAQTSLEAIDNSEAISYAELDKAAERYKDMPFYLNGKVLQATEENGTTILRVEMLSTHESDYGTDRTILVYYPDITEAVEGDMVEIYGIILGKKSYTNGMGAQVTLPAVAAASIENLLDVLK